jgi:hypothetical protein
MVQRSSLLFIRSALEMNREIGVYHDFATEYARYPERDE